MILREALAAAARWVEENERPLPGYIGAYAGGSCAALNDADALPVGSDLDVFVVLDCAPPQKRGKFLHRGVLLEISYIAADALFPPEKALADYHIAHSLRVGRVISDPEGRLAALQSAVVRRFSTRQAVTLRRDHALSRVRAGLSAELNPSLPDRTLGWLFPTGITTHAVLAAAQKNPTVRLRYLRAREVLGAEGMEDVHEALLELSGFAAVTQKQARRMFDRLLPMYDCAAKHGRTPFFFLSDVSPQSRPALESLSALIDRGDHREALFWILATYARCMKILEADNPDALAAFRPDFGEALETVGRGTPGEILAANERTLGYLPELEKITDEIIARHTDP